MTPFLLQTLIILAQRVFRAWLLWHFIATISTLTEFAIYFFVVVVLFAPSLCFKVNLHPIETVQISEYKVVQCFGSAPMKTFCSNGLTEIINNQNGSINHFFLGSVLLENHSLFLGLRTNDCDLVCVRCAPWSTINSQMHHCSSDAKIANNNTIIYEWTDTFTVGCVRFFYLFTRLLTHSLVRLTADFPYVLSNGEKNSNGNNKESADSNNTSVFNSVRMKVFKYITVIESINASCVW